MKKFIFLYIFLFLFITPICFAQFSDHLNLATYSDVSDTADAIRSILGDSILAYGQAFKDSAAVVWADSANAPQVIDSSWTFNQNITVVDTAFADTLMSSGTALLISKPGDTTNTYGLWIFNNNLIEEGWVFTDSLSPINDYMMIGTSGDTFRYYGRHDMDTLIGLDMVEVDGILYTDTLIALGTRLLVGEVGDTVKIILADIDSIFGADTVFSATIMAYVFKTDNDPDSVLSTIGHARNIVVGVLSDTFNINMSVGASTDTTIADTLMTEDFYLLVGGTVSTNILNIISDSTGSISGILGDTVRYILTNEYYITMSDDTTEIDTLSVEDLYIEVGGVHTRIYDILSDSVAKFLLRSATNDSIIDVLSTTFNINMSDDTTEIDTLSVKDFYVEVGGVHTNIYSILSDSIQTVVKITAFVDSLNNYHYVTSRWDFAGDSTTIINLRVDTLNVTDWVGINGTDIFSILSDSVQLFDHITEIGGALDSLADKVSQTGIGDTLDAIQVIDNIWTFSHSITTDDTVFTGYINKAGDILYIRGLVDIDTIRGLDSLSSALIQASRFQTYPHSDSVLWTIGAILDGNLAITGDWGFGADSIRFYKITVDTLYIDDSLRVGSGSVTINNDGIIVGGTVYIGDDSLNIGSGDFVKTKGGRTGIGTADPSQLLDIEGASAYLDLIATGGSAGFAVSRSSTAGYSNINLQTNSLDQWNMQMRADYTDVSALIFRDEGGNNNVIFEQDGDVIVDDSTFFVDADDKVGILTKAPDSTLDVSGSLHITEHVLIEGELNASFVGTFVDSIRKETSDSIQTINDITEIGGAIDSLSDKISQTGIGDTLDADQAIDGIWNFVGDSTAFDSTIVVGSIKFINYAISDTVLFDALEQFVADDTARMYDSNMILRNLW